MAANLFRQNLIGNGLLMGLKDLDLQGFQVGEQSFGRAHVNYGFLFSVRVALPT
jgi:hypothetical protein